jgi:glycosyltransferase involved in cell wall biosynthesis
MNDISRAPSSRVRVLYSFPHKIGSGRIADTAWHQVAGAAQAGADVLTFTGAVHRDLPGSVRVRTTLARGPARIPYRLLGRRAFDLHDAIVARALPRLAASVDVVHAWPLGARRTLLAAARLGIPTVLERPNTHTRYAYKVVRDECERLDVPLPSGHEHAFNASVLETEEVEYELASYLLCPSDFVVKTFLDEGFLPDKLIRHLYGFDETVFYPDTTPQHPRPGLRALFVGVAAVRKGLHFALEAWLRSSASRDGEFLIAGAFLPAYAEKLAPLLAAPSVHVLGHRNDVAELMRHSDILLLPSVEEGSALACSEAIGSGCVPLVSNATSGVCRHMANALIHEVADVDVLERHISMLDEDRELLANLRRGALESAPGLTWSAAGTRLVDIYRQVASAGPGHPIMT